MAMELFRKIIDEAATIGRIEEVCLTGLGEPLLDRQVVERVRYIRKKMPLIQTMLYTNGSNLSDEKVKGLRDAGLGVLYISLNAVNRDKRLQIMGLDDYEIVETKIKEAIRIAGDRMKVVVKAVVSKDLMENGESDEFLKKWGGPFNEVNQATGKYGHAFLHLEGNWAGEMWPMRVKPTTACSRALNQIMVLWDGRVSLCCFDGEGEVILGDLNTQTIREVFNGPPATGIRQAHAEGKRGELKLCATCTAI